MKRVYIAEMVVISTLRKRFKSHFRFKLRNVGYSREIYENTLLDGAYLRVIPPQSQHMVPLFTCPSDDLSRLLKISIVPIEYIAMYR